VFTQGQWAYEDIPVPEPAVPTEPIPSIEDRLAAAEAAILDLMGV
jgi:hypothetical protein